MGQMGILCQLGILRHLLARCDVPLQQYQNSDCSHEDLSCLHQPEPAHHLGPNRCLYLHSPFHCFLGCWCSIPFLFWWSSGRDRWYSIPWACMVRNFSIAESWNRNNNLRYYMIYLFFALLWVVAMIISCTQFIIIVAVCVWYFTSTSDTRGSASLL